MSATMMTPWDEQLYELLDWLDKSYGLQEWSEAEHGRHIPTDIVPFVAGLPEPPEMLVPSWLVRGVLHLLYSDAEAGKTWLALMLALLVMRAGNRVVWVDEELGPRDLGDRLRALGATTEDIERRLIYFAFAGWEMTEEAKRSWREMLRTLADDETVPLGLVVFDTVTDALAANGIDENSGVQVTTWIKTYPEAATDIGVTTLLLDHTAKGGEVTKHAVGSRAKRAKAKVQYGLSAKRPYDRARIGKVGVTLTKNTLGAEIPYRRDLAMGGDGEGGFIIDAATMTDALLEDDGDNDVVADPLEFRILSRLQEHGPQNVTQVRSAVSGKHTKIGETLARLVEQGKLRATPQGRSTIYEVIVDGQDNAQLPSDAAPHLEDA